MLEVDAHAHSSADPDRVFALLADAASWPRWSPLDELEGVEGEGVGEVRRFRKGRVHSVEEVTALEPPRRFGYAFLSGLPVRDYTAVVALAPAPASGTDIHWRSTFRPRYPGTGWALRRGLRGLLKDFAEGLARAAER